MIIRFVCPFGHRLAAHPDSAGAKAQCPECLAVLYVPSPQPRTSGKVKKVWNAPQPIQDMEAMVQSALGDDWGGGDGEVPEDAFVPLDDAPSEVVYPKAPSVPVADAPSFVEPPGKSVAALAAADAASRAGLAARTVGPNPAERGAYGSYPPPAPAGGRGGPGSSLSTPGGAARGDAAKGPAASGYSSGGGSGSTGPGSGVGRSPAAGGFAGPAAGPGSSTYGANAGRSGAAAPVAGTPIATAAAVPTSGGTDSSSRMAPLRWDDLPATAPATESAPTSSIHTAGGSTVSVGKTAAFPTSGVETAPVGGPPAASSPLHPPNYANHPPAATTRSGVPYPEASPTAAPAGGVAASSVLPPLGMMGTPAVGAGGHPAAPTGSPNFSPGGTTSFPAPAAGAAGSPVSPSPSGGGLPSYPAPNVAALGGPSAPSFSGGGAPSFPAPSAYAPSPFAPSPFAASGAAIGGGQPSAPSAPLAGSPGAPSPFAPSPFAPSPFAAPSAASPEQLAAAALGAPTGAAGGTQPLAPSAFSAAAGGAAPTVPGGQTQPGAAPKGVAEPFAFPGEGGNAKAAVEAPIIFSDAGVKKSLWQAAGPARLWKLYLLSLCVAFFAAASGLPTYHFLSAGAALPLWAKVALGLTVLKFLYAVFMALVPDWSTVWLGMMLLALLAVMYGIGWILASFTAPGAPMLFGLDAVREHLKFWCVLMGLSSLGLSVVCARFSHQWRRDFELELKAARDAKKSRVAPPTFG